MNQRRWLPLPQHREGFGARFYSTRLTHVNERGEANMVDVAGKQPTRRTASAEGFVRFSNASVCGLIQANALKKGDVIATARVAGIMAAKRTSDLIPLCHPLMLTRVAVDIAVEPEAQRVRITAQVECVERTGVEMEALTAVATACLCVYDCTKAVDKGMEISGVTVTSKTK